MEITGKLLRDAIISGANNIQLHKKQVDELNVFPVPDGDTGTNMSMTIGNAVTDLSRMADSATAGEVAKVAASAMLRGARGNSGVILSLLFRGLSKGLADKKVASSEDISVALTLGVEAAYKSVMKPTEGTMLTVARVSADKYSELLKEKDDFKSIWSDYVIAADEILQKTPEYLPVLAKAGVVDAGGMGYLKIIEGMKQVFLGGEIITTGEVVETTSVEISAVTNIAGTVSADIEFGYCTEFIVLKDKADGDALKLRAFLETIGDSVVCVDDEDIIKIHVHTNNPGTAMQEGLKFGQLTKIKIENMREQHTHQMEEAEAQKAQVKSTLPRKEPEKEFGFVAVAAGKGNSELFRDLGVDVVVEGGQTMNPSTEDILTAIHATPAKTVFVLPNNKNIILAAEQAVPFADRNVIVLQSRSIPQGIAAMLAFEEGIGLEENSVNMTNSLDNVGSGSITFAVRDSDYEGHKIKQGEILGLENGKLTVLEKDLTKALTKLTRKLLKSSSSYITLIYGSDVSDEEAQASYDHLRTKISDDISIVLVNGGQPVYYYIISVE